MKNSHQTAGAFPTMVTPYNEDGSVDLGAARALTAWYYENGCHGIFAACQSSEIFFLTEAERAALTRTVVDEADRLAAQSKDGRRMTIVASGHVGNTQEQQVHELNAIAAEGPDALILITNRMDMAWEGDDAWIRDCDKLVSQLPDIPLGVYECPYPKKRLLTEPMLRYCADSGRFAFIKDTCCDAAEIAKRVKILSGSTLQLYNANAQTLLETLRAGAHGYCSVMCNFHPKLYVYLCEHFADEPEKADIVQSFLGTAAFTEAMAYPVTAKYHLKEIAGLPFNSIASRARSQHELTDYQTSSIQQMHHLASEIEKALKL
jgi:4-hydroxy-tetrahydrodipicolinate synthase